jgi:uncharacterized protein YciI
MCGRGWVDGVRNRLYVIIYRPGPHWQEGKPFSEQDLRAHGAYMKTLYDDGVLHRGGPFTDDAGGVAIVSVTDDHAADGVVQGDPGVAAGIFVAEAHPWLSVDWDSYES